MMAGKCRLGWSDGPSSFYVTDYYATDSPSSSMEPNNNMGYLAVDVVNDNILGGAMQGLYTAGYPVFKGGTLQSNAQPNLGTGNGDKVLSATSERLFLNSYGSVGGSYQGARFTEIDPDGGNTFLSNNAIEGLTQLVQPRDLTIDSSGNYYFLTSPYVSSVYRLAITKVNAAGTEQWSYGLDVNAISNARITTDNTYIYTVTAIPNGIAVFKIDPTTPSIVWQRDYDLGSDSANRPVIKVDSSGNVYVGFIKTPSPTNYYEIKYNSAGTVQHTRRYYSGSSSLQYGEGAFDEDGYYYFAWNVTPGGSDFKLSKYRNGTHSWTKTISNSLAVNYSCYTNTFTDGAFVYCGAFLDDSGSSGKRGVMFKLDATTHDQDNGTASSHSTTITGTTSSSMSTTTGAGTAGTPTYTLSDYSSYIQKTTYTPTTSSTYPFGTHGIDLL
jgi:hypothetical protein